MSAAKAKRKVIGAMLALSGMDRCAMAIAPKPAAWMAPELTPAQTRDERRRLAEMEIETRCEARSWPRLANIDND